MLSNLNDMLVGESIRLHNSRDTVIWVYRSGKVFTSYIVYLTDQQTGKALHSTKHLSLQSSLDCIYLIEFLQGKVFDRISTW